MKNFNDTVQRKSVLMTGAFGNLGQEALREFFDHVENYDISVLVRPSDKNRKIAKKWGDKLRVIWGDVTDEKALAQAMQGAHTVVHLAAIIPPAVYGNEVNARRVNVDATSTIVALAELAGVEHIVYTSSVVVYGASRADSQAVATGTTLSPIEKYGQQKVESESIIRSAKCHTTILRVGASPPVAIQDVDSYVFEIGLHSKIEFVHPADVGLAIVNCIGNTACYDKIFNLGGGANNRFTYEQFFDASFEQMGVGAMPHSAFSDATYCTNWMDTTESQAILRYQRYGYQDWLDDLIGLLGWRVALIKWFRPVVRWWILRASGYWRAA